MCKKTSGKTVCAPAQREAQKEEREMKKGKVHIIFGTGMGKQRWHWDVVSVQPCTAGR